MEDQGLPTYNTAVTGPSYADQQSEHLCALENKTRKWLSLFVKSRATGPSSLPVFFEGDTISGRVELHLDRAETIKSITITVQAGTTAVGQDENIFLDMKETLWTPIVEDGKTSSKLNGLHSWPFKFTLPREVQVSEIKGKAGKLYRLPPSFSERASPAYIDYRLVVTVKRGIFKVNQVLSTGFGYHPSVIPDPPSRLRQLAYEKASSLPGPDVDPGGWKVLPSLRVQGILFEARDVEVECTLAIATPLSYAIGSPLPLILTLSSQDGQALDILSAPAAIRIHLVRYMGTGSDAVDESEQRRTDNYFPEGAGKAFFWPTEGNDENSSSRVLQGELEIAKTLKPSFTFPRFTIKYSLEFLPFHAAGFVQPKVEDSTALLSEKVTIATKQTPGITPRSHAPPGYEKPKQVDFNKSVGLLENGNQRFYHHGH